MIVVQGLSDIMKTKNEKKTANAFEFLSSIDKKEQSVKRYTTISYNPVEHDEANIPVHFVPSIQLLVRAVGRFHLHLISKIYLIRLNNFKDK